MNKDGSEQTTSKPFTPSVSTSIFSFLGGRAWQLANFFRKKREAGENTFSAAKVQMERELFYIEKHPPKETTCTLNRTVKELIKHNGEAGVRAVLANIERLPDSSLSYLRTKMGLKGMPIKDFSGRYDKLSLKEASLLKLHLLILEKINAHLEESDREEWIQLNQSSLFPESFKPYGTDYLKNFEEAMSKRSKDFSDIINLNTKQLGQEINGEIRKAKQLAFLAGLHKTSGLKSSLQVVKYSPIGDEKPISLIFELAGLGIPKLEIKSKPLLQPKSDSAMDLDQEQDSTMLNPK